jgi:hypothetical protein
MLDTVFIRQKPTGSAALRVFDFRPDSGYLVRESLQVHALVAAQQLALMRTEVRVPD